MSACFVGIVLDLRLELTHIMVTLLLLLLDKKKTQARLGKILIIFNCKVGEDELEMLNFSFHVSCVTCHQHIVFCCERHLDSS